ncbi:MAG: hypothetical protein ACFFCS_02320 [Candidatus Hodarchaeota archaeon]
MNTERIAREVKRLLAIENLDEMDIEYRNLSFSKDEEVFFILLEILSSGKVLHVFKAAKHLTLKGNTKYIPDMKEIRKNLPPKKGLDDYRRAVDKAIMILELREAGKSCNCDFYALSSSGFSNMSIPREEADNGSITIVEQLVHQKSYYSDYFCICNTCERGWQVQDEIGYHYPLYKWEEITFTPKYDEYHEKYVKGVKNVNRDVKD